ncbi:MAG: hypothetical protein AAGB22_05235 [Bacteroidota bacterium]
MHRIYLIALLLLTGCTSLQTVRSRPEVPNPEIAYPYYDQESRLVYNVTHDDENLHVRLKARDRTAILKILRTGLTIYFDPAGKKDRTMYVQYPLAKDRKTTRDQFPNPGQNGAPPPELRALLDELPKQAVFQSAAGTERFDVLLSASGIKITLQQVDNAELLYDLVIPQARLAEGGLEGLSNLSVGIISGSVSIPLQQRGGPSGVPTGGALGGLPNARTPPAGNGRLNWSAMGTPIEIWFKVAFPTSP